MLTAIVILSMALTPLAVARRCNWLPAEGRAVDGRHRARADGLNGSVLIIGFGRFGQVASQALLARGVDVVDHRHRHRDDPQRRRVRLQGLLRRRHAARRAAAPPAPAGRAIVVCVDKPGRADRIVELVKAEFPHGQAARARLRPRARARADRAPASTTRSARRSSPRWRSARGAARLGVPDAEAAEIARTCAAATPSASRSRSPAAATRRGIG